MDRVEQDQATQDQGNKGGRTAQRRWANRLGGGMITGLAIVGVMLMQRSQLTRSTQPADYAQADREEALRLKILQQSPTFGFSNLVANWTFINFLMYYGDDEARSQTGYGLGPEYFDIVTRLDPWFVQIYPFLSAAVSYQAGQPEKAIGFMQRGTTALSPQIPKAFIAWRYKGLDQLLLLGDVPGAIASHKMAAEWVKGTPDQDLAPLFQQTAQFLETDPNSVPIRINSWAEIYIQAANTRDKQTMARAEREIKALGGQIQVRDGKVSLQMPPPQPAPAPSTAPPTPR
jgi:hypothetical protein